MPLDTPTGGGSGAPKTPAPAGTHLARCVRVIDLGTQNDTFNGKPKQSEKVMLCWELPTKLHVFDEEKGPEPYLLSKEYTWFLGDSSNLTKDLTSWKGEKMSEAVKKTFKITNLIGKTCLLGVAHKQKEGDDRVFANVTSILPMVEGMECPKQVTESIIYDVRQGRDATFAKLPAWIQKKIEACENWKTRSAPEPEPEPETDPEPEPDEIPMGGAESTELHKSNQPF